MIKKFGSLYAGNIDMDNIGLDGTPVNDRLYSDDELFEGFYKGQRIAQLMDRVGYDTFWIAEHHFQREGYEVIPNILLYGLHLTHVTQQIKIGCGFNINPMWHPLRLAEDFATVDRLTGGRIVFGLGRGYHNREVDTFGVPSTQSDSDANREMFEEQVEIIYKAFNQQSFSHQGKYFTVPAKVPYRGYTVEEITLVPRPLTLPVDTWQPMVTASQRAMDFMVKFGIKGMMGGGAASHMGPSYDTAVRWRETLARNGKETELGGDLMFGFTVFVDDTVEKAVNLARPYWEEFMKMFAPLGFMPQLSPDQIAGLADPKRARLVGLPTVESAIDRGSFICGPPEFVKERLMEVQEAYPGVEEIMVSAPAATMPESLILEQLEWIAKDVMPAFKAQEKVAAAPAD